MSGADLRVTETGGREATTRCISPRLALSVGMPSVLPPAGWTWAPLTSLARLESGHTPSRKHPEYWGGDIPWMGIRDAKAHHGRRILSTIENTNTLGIRNSSARILPINTVCLSRTASVGYVVVMGRPLATSQDFVNWVCTDDLDHNFLKYLLIAEDDNLLRFASGSVHSTIYFPEVKAFHICYPPIAEQKRIVRVLDEAFASLATARSNAEKNVQNARALFEGQLQSTFSRCSKGWSETTIGTEVELLAGFAFKSAKYTHRPDDTRLLRGDNIMQGALRWEDVKRWPSSEARDYRRYQLEVADVVLAMDRPWVKAGLKRAQLSQQDLPCLLVQRTCRLRGGTNVHQRFLYYLISSGAFVRHILGSQTGIGVPHISCQQIEDFRFSKPQFSEQIEIANQLDAFSAKVERLECIYQQKLAALAELKKSLLHHAFSGEL